MSHYHYHMVLLMMMASTSTLCYSMTITLTTMPSEHSAPTLTRKTSGHRQHRVRRACLMEWSSVDRLMIV
jgi:hypothetical protein